MSIEFVLLHNDNGIDVITILTKIWRRKWFLV